MNKSEQVEFLRKNNFNCFPIPEGHKIADYRYKAEQTAPNQDIEPEENYGYIPVRGAGTCILDFDDKERFREFAQENIDKGYRVTESPHGWHIPMTGFTGEIGKIRLFEEGKWDKPKLEIQGPKQYCVGPGSVSEDGLYKLYGEKLCNANGKDFNDFVDSLAKHFNLVGPKKNSSSYAHMREQFKKGIPPTNGQSNDYFFHAALQCNTDELTRDEAVEKIHLLYDKWTESKSYSGRTWTNIEAKINDVYDNDYRVQRGGNRKKKDGAIEIARKMLVEYQLFSDKKTRDLYITDNGFLENVTIAMKKTITKEYESGRSETEEILHFLIGFADELPPLNYDYVMFKNGMFDLQHNIITEKDPNIICAIGFKDYDYLECPECPRFCKLIDDHVMEKSRSNLFAALSMAVAPERETRMSVFYGSPGTGKTTLAETLTFSLGQDAAVPMKVDDFFKDRASEARIKGKVLLYFQDTPKTWNDWSKIKVTTGENQLSIRDMYKKSEPIHNMLSVIISTNHLIEIDEEEEAPMFDRLALVFFHGKVRGTKSENKNFSMEVARDEGEAIISWCLNLRKDGHQFESSEDTQQEWNRIIKPEQMLFGEHFHYQEGEDGMSIHRVMQLLNDRYPDVKLDIQKLEKAIKSRMYTKKGEMYLGMTWRNSQQDVVNSWANIA